MRAVVIHEHGGYEQLKFEDRPVPEPGPGELRVALRAAGCNQLDTWLRRGVPGHGFPLPLVPGSDGAGVVDALGSKISDEDRLAFLDDMSKTYSWLKDPEVEQEIRAWTLRRLEKELNREERP